ncbi:hypothetical protein Q1695_012709 [Nippostrongylus brasiliensis]|nr:hypothetical protein Q1695_012709 [Nippostrongylus brasiliensis]
MPPYLVKVTPAMENSVNGLESMAQTAVESRPNTFTPIVDDLSFATAKIVMDDGIGASGQYPALINLFIAMERIAALQFSAWYRVFWREHNKIYLILVASLLTFVFVVLAFVINSYHVHVSPTRMCAVMDSTGIIYGTIHYSLISFVYLFCFIALVVTFINANRSRIPSKDEIRRQRMMLAINVISVLLVSIPNLVLILNEWKAPKISDLTTG